VSSTNDLASLGASFFPDHRLAAHFPSDSNGTGSAIFVHSRVAFRTSLQLTESKHRLLSLVIRRPAAPDLVFSSLYAPPQGAIGGAKLKDSYLDAALFYRNALLLGDLNARSVALGCRKTNPNGQVLLRYLDTSENIALNDPAQPTYLRTNSGYADCIDWAVATATCSSRLSCGRGPDVGSDHYPLLVFTAGHSIPIAPSGPPLPRWRTSGKSLEDFSLALDFRARQLTTSLPTSPAEIDDLACQVEEAFTASADSCLPRSQFRGPKPRQPGAWTRLLRQQKRRLRLLITRRGSSQSLLRDLRAVESHLADSREQDRSRVHNRLNSVLVTGPKHPSFWHTVRKELKVLSPPPPPLQSPDGHQSACTPQDRVEVLADHLARTFSAAPSDAAHSSFHAWVAEEVRNHPVLRPRPHVTYPDSTDEDDDEPTRPISTEEIEWALATTRKGRAPGPDGIGSDLIRATPESMLTILANLLTASLAAGYIPNRWKLAWVRMIPKPGKSATCPSNYRPISLTSYFGKIAEKIVAYRLLRYCDSRSLLPIEQSGFRPGRDTIEQPTLLLQRIGQAANGGLTTAVAALDIAKAFDSVWHDGCLHSCLQDLSAPTCRWLAAFLSNRSAAVIEDGTLSRPFPIKSGVPQGSPLSPLLFSIFLRTAPVPRESMMGASMYADDIAIWAAGPSPAAAWSRIHSALTELTDWANHWGLAFSIPKTQAAHLGRRRCGWSPDDISPPSFLDTPLQWETRIDLLGCRLDSWQTFKPHAYRLRQSVRPRVDELRRLLLRHRTLPVRTAVMLHQALIRSRLLYAAPAMATAHSATWSLLESLERRSLRTACRLPLDAPAEEVMDRARLKPLRTTAKDLGGRFLKRHTRRGNPHLLSGFAPVCPQRPDIVRIPTSLDLLVQATDEATRRTIRQTYPDYFRTHTSRRSRASRVERYWDA